MSLIERLSAMLAGPVRPGPNTGPAPGPTATPAAPTLPELSADDPRLPDTARPRVARLLALAAEIEARNVEDPLLASAITEVRQMRDHHLPQLVRSYAEIPPAHRAEIFRATGHSASYNLGQALDRMIARVEVLARELAQEDINSFADNLRFINQRYGPGDPS